MAKRYLDYNLNQRVRTLCALWVRDHHPEVFTELNQKAAENLPVVPKNGAPKGNQNWRGGTFTPKRTAL